MAVPGTSFQHAYRLVLADDGRRPALTIRVEASCAESARRQCQGREAELFEGERSLGRIICMQQGGYWLLSPSGCVKGPG